MGGLHLVALRCVVVSSFCVSGGRVAWECEAAVEVQGVPLGGLWLYHCCLRVLAFRLVLAF